MQEWMGWVIMVGVSAGTAILYLLLPRISRRGLLFGVYVGVEPPGEGEAARALLRRWYLGMTVWLAGSLAVAIALGIRHGSVVAAGVAPLLVSVGFFVEYLRAHLRARALAPSAPPPPGVAVLGPESPAPLLPWVATAFGALGGLAALAYTALFYGSFPDRMPIHFGPSGAPDRWVATSPVAAFALPFLTLVVGVGTGVVAVLVSRAKRALRHPDGGVSLKAQERFRAVLARFLSIVAMLCTAFLALMAVSAVEVARGAAAALPPAIPILTLVLVGVSILGSLYIALVYGQGGSRLEAPAAAAPLTDGLADNRHWVLGLLYFNRDDPSYLVERRFGLGYTLNFGNWRAVAVLGAFLALIALVVVGVRGAGG